MFELQREPKIAVRAGLVSARKVGDNTAEQWRTCGRVMEMPYQAHTLTPSVLSMVTKEMRKQTRMRCVRFRGSSGSQTKLCDTAMLSARETGDNTGMRDANMRCDRDAQRHTR